MPGVSQISKHAGDVCVKKILAIKKQWKKSVVIRRCWLPLASRAQPKLTDQQLPERSASVAVSFSSKSLM
jgi:hypothetical protein